MFIFHDAEVGYPWSPLTWFFIADLEQEVNSKISWVT